jgi:hypothetical protein
LDRAVLACATPPVFDWLLATFSYQGISDRVAREYMDKHGTASWSEIEAALRVAPTCGKLRSYWHHEGCRYDRGSFTCSEPAHIDGCPVPRPRLRNGRLNQTAYSLFLFVWDIANADLIGWLDRRPAGNGCSPVCDRCGGYPAGCLARSPPQHLRRVRQGPDDGVFDLADRSARPTAPFGSRPAKP